MNSQENEKARKVIPRRTVSNESTESEDSVINQEEEQAEIDIDNI